MTRVKKLMQKGRVIFSPDNDNDDSMIAVNGQRGRHSDGGGLYFVVGSKGECRWAFIYKSRTRKLASGLPAPVEMGIGGAPDGSDKPAVSLADARRRAAELRAVLVNGKDPKTERDAGRAAVAPASAPAMTAIARPSPDGQLNITFGEFADRYFEENRKGWKNVKHIAQWKRSLTEEAAPLRPIMVRDIDTPHILDLLRPIIATKYETGRRLQERINRVLGAATVQGYRDNTPSPARWVGHLSESLPRKAANAKKGHAALPYAEAPSFMRDLRKRNSLSAFALQWTICTVARTTEATHGKWTEIDFANKLWIVPPERMKGNREHRVPLTDAMMTLLGEVRKFSHGDYIFAHGNVPLSNMAMAELLKGMRPGVTVHGMRSTFSDWGNETTDHSDKVIDFCLAHINGDKAEAAYRRGTSLAKRRKVLEDWEKYLAG